jgi:glycosyltransferase involved in cell wall biosynthesis
MSNVTFIIPTIGRATLKNTLLSLINQTNPNWNAIVIFDGIEPDKNLLFFSDNKLDSRIKILQCQKLGEGSNYAGRVRNYGINYAKTEWIAFVDDDDTIKDNYVEIFLYEINKYKVDVVIFRMLFCDEIMPHDKIDNFIINNVGISFALKKSIFDNGIIFESSKEEDFHLLDKIRENGYKMMISPHLLYFVKDCQEYSRIFINTTIQNATL